MSLAAAHSLNPNLSRRTGLAALGVGVGTALVVATLSNPRLARAVGEGVSDGIHSFQTVAAMLAERSPGERPDGALASLKAKRQATLHARALPKVRGPGPAAYEALVGPPPPPPVILPQAPLYTTVAAGPPATIPPVTVAAPGGPPIMSSIPSPGGGGGGGVFIPTPTALATPDVPPTPASPVPEPATWAMMLLGLALVGRAARGGVIAAKHAALG